VDVFDQLSFYFMLQKPEQGGELSLFDLEWQEGQSKASLYENHDVRLPDISVHTIYKEEAQIIDPQPGDLVIFAAGQIWHRVEEVLGNKERMTLGGFAAYSYDKLTVYHWS
jgi:hapalindole-type alkaloid chlorinase